MGPIPVQLNAVDASGNSQSATVAFTLDTTPPPVPVFDLSKTDQTGAPGSHQTQSQTVTLVGQTGASDAVTLESNGQTIANTTANTTGAFEFDNVSLTQGNNPLTVQAIDAASNTSTYSVTIQLQTATSPPKPASRSLPFRIPWTAAPRCRSISTRPAVRSIRRWICRSLAPTATP
jgi:Big-like domain-containing protein